MADWSAKMAKIEEASRKKDELDKEFKTNAKVVLESKMEQYEEKREAQITEIKEKLKVNCHRETCYLNKFDQYFFLPLRCTQRKLRRHDTVWSTQNLRSSRCSSRINCELPPRFVMIKSRKFWTG